MFSFKGRTGRIAWLIYAIGSIATFIVALRALSDIPTFYRNFLGYLPLPEEQDTAEVVLVCVMVASFIVLLASTLRRLRDAGVNRPLLGLILGLVVPGFGWFVLLIRLLFGKETVARPTPSASRRGADQTRRQEMPWSKAVENSGRDVLVDHLSQLASDASSEQRRRSERPKRARDFINQVEGAAKARRDKQAHVHVINISPEGPTVRRTRRNWGATGVRRIAF